ncbi:hypothetical protein KJE01_22635 [Escherichia marmotae]|jgi:hypothetical protein|uniref:hypothetical protein n=1 Tax=Escherichia TaxID=561 RepID=UPI000390AFC8|nr:MULTISPECIES: hypothetical protein [Escherichia]EAB7041481.1 hypothetical protein [Salmonella enterica subsp. enterica serovar Mikawasima]EFA4130040.1 hypothetical protein [Escherichia coli O13]EFZ2275744.1 hypothetical protein [Shigella sonnei]EEQ2459958.1 hypothetical protein [Escherichia coli]EFC4078798.1 hypothetical protein [Escherichia coli]
MKRKAIAITESTYLDITRIALEISQKTGQIVTWSEVVHFMIKNYLNDAKQDMIHQRNQKK